MGLNDDIRRIAPVFADNGYMALAPDLVGAGFKPLCIARFFQGIGKAGTGRPYREMAAFQDWLGEAAVVDADRIGMAGLLRGRRLRDAVRGPRRAQRCAPIAPFYGDAARGRVDHPGPVPHRRVVRRPGRVARQASARRLEAALDAGRASPHDVKTYPDAGHSFMSRARRASWERSGRGPRCTPASTSRPSADAWARVLAFFGEHLAPRDVAG